VWAFGPYRWYAPSLDLLIGEYQLDKPLTIDHWGDALGGRDPNAFGDALRQLDRVGFVFGDPAAGATGHGVYATGPARFTLLEYTIY